VNCTSHPLPPMTTFSQRRGVFIYLSADGGPPFFRLEVQALSFLFFFYLVLLFFFRKEEGLSFRVDLFFLLWLFLVPPLFYFSESGYFARHSSLLLGRSSVKRIIRVPEGAPISPCWRRSLQGLFFSASRQTCPLRYERIISPLLPNIPKNSRSPSPFLPDRSPPLPPLWLGEVTYLLLQDSCTQGAYVSLLHQSLVQKSRFLSITSSSPRKFACW